MVRTAERSDYKAVKSLIRAGEQEGSLAHRRKKDIKKSIKKRRTLVAEQDGEVVGTVGVEVYNRRIAEVRSLYVAPEARGNGLATELVNGILEQPVSVLPSGTIFAISETPFVFFNAGFHPVHDKKLILHKRI